LLRNHLYTQQIHLNRQDSLTLRHHLSGLVERIEAAQAFAARPPAPSDALHIQRTGAYLGRTRLDIDLDMLERLFDAKYTHAQIAAIIGCSGRTVRSRLLEMGLWRRNYTEITDDLL
jgi:hypothetical protein